MTSPVIAVFAGGTSAEREVSIASGAACAAALACSFPTRLFEIDAEALPEGYDPGSQVVFSTLHGTFGEDGGMQHLLDGAGGQYGGCDAASSALTMDKAATKRAVAFAGVAVADDLVFNAPEHPEPAAVVSRLGPKLILKPNNQGSSVGLRVIDDLAALVAALASAQAGQWIIEPKIEGREVSVGILGGRALGIVEIRPQSGVYDYASKYTKGMTEYLAPAPLGDALTAGVKAAAEAAFAACGCRDYARADFMISASGQPFLLEINPLPGMKETSLLPKSAHCAGLNFTALVKAMILPAVERFRLGAAVPVS